MADKGWDLGGYLREQREHARLSVRQLANLAGVSNPYLSQVERGLRKPSAEVLQQIARGLRISAEALYVRAGILDSEGRPDVEAAVNADPALNDRQRRVLLDIYASFRAENARAAAEPEPEPVPRRSPVARVRKVTAKAGPAKKAAAAAAAVAPVGADADAATSDTPVAEPPVVAARKPRKRATASRPVVSPDAASPDADGAPAGTARITRTGRATRSGGGAKAARAPRSARTKTGTDGSGAPVEAADRSEDPAPND